MTEQEKAERFAGKAPPLNQAERDAINALFPTYIFRRSRTNEIWTTCCRRHLTAGCSDEGLRVPDGDLEEVMCAPHQREPESSRFYPPAPTVKCPVCGQLAIVKELGRTGGRDNLSRYRRAVVLRWYRGALWARAYDCGKHYSRDRGYSLTGEPKSKLVGVYRFKPGMAEGTTRPWYWDSPFCSIDRQDGPLVKAHWNIHGPWNANAEYGIGYDVIGLDEIQKSPFCYCMAEEAEKKAIKFLQFLTACCFYPRQIEMLMKAGMNDVVRDLVERGVKHAAVINWDEPNPSKAFKVPRQDMKTFLGTSRDIRILELHKRLKGRASLTECAGWITNGVNIQGTFRAAKKWNLPPEKLMRYLDGNVGCARYGGIESLAAALRFWEDYLTAAEAVNYPLHRENVLLPKNLGEAHDRAAEQHRERMTRERQAEQRENDRLMAADYAERKVKLEKKYGFSLDGYVIRVPESGEDILDEGRKLKHCVGGYADRHLKGVLTILFLRRVSELDRPYVTIEMSGNRIVQVHGYQNDRGGQSPRLTHKEFFDTWLAWLKAGSKRDKDGKPILPRKRKAAA